MKNGKVWIERQGVTRREGLQLTIYEQCERRPTGSLEAALELEGMTPHRAVRFLMGQAGVVKVETIQGSKKIFVYRKTNGKDTGSISEPQ